MKKIIVVALMLAITLALSSCLNFGDPNDENYLLSLITEDVWEEMFPERWGIGEHWEWTYETHYASFYDETTMKYDLYSYANFQAAVKELSYIQIKIAPKQYDYKQMYRKDSRTDSDWVHIGATTSWTQESEVNEPDEIVDFGHFINKPGASNIDKNRELAAFLANIGHETGESDYDGNYNYALFYREEVGMEGTANIGYRQADDNYPPTDGKSYHGRGPIQLSYNYNYGPASLLIYGDKTKLLNNPELVMTDGKLAFMTAIWFWMLPQSPKPSCHEVMYSDYDPSSWGFGHTVMVINGGVEGGGAMKPRRFTFYKAFAEALGTTIGGAGEELNTDNLFGY